MAINEELRMDLDEDAVVFDNPSFDQSIVGVTTDGRVVYDYEKMILELMKDDDITEEEAIEWIEYNTIRAIPYAGDMAPIIAHMLKGGLYG